MFARPGSVRVGEALQTTPLIQGLASAGWYVSIVAKAALGSPLYGPSACFVPTKLGNFLTCCDKMQLEGELYNGRVAMLAVVGILSVEALGRGPWWAAVNQVTV